MAKAPTRLPPTPSTLKKLFAYSGNRCAMPDCKETIVHSSGTMLGKVAHICAAERGAARYDKKMSDEDRRSFENLFIVCGKHHDLIDDLANVAKYPAELLRKHKEAREARFRKAEQQLLDSFSDTTQATQPSYPGNLGALAAALNASDVEGHPEEIAGMRVFIDKLKECPLDQRGFALELSRRMRRRNVDQLSADDVLEAFKLSVPQLRKHMGILEEHHLGCIDEGEYQGKYDVTIFERAPAGNPFIEILDFCDATATDPETLILGLRIDHYDN
jgi:hypothetical protein